MDGTAGEQSGNEAKFETALNTLTDALVKGDESNPSLKELIKNLSKNVDQLTKETKEASDKADIKNNTREDYNKIALDYAQAHLNGRKAKFEDKGENETDRSTKEKLKRIEDITSDKLKQVEGFIGKFIPKTVQNILGFIGGKELLEGLNKAIIEKSQDLFAGEELKEANAIKELERKINKKSVEQKKLQAISKQNTDVLNKELNEQYGITTEDNLSNVSKEVPPVKVQVDTAANEKEKVEAKTPVVMPANGNPVTATSPVIDETSANSKVVEDKGAIESVENAPAEIELTKISDEAADAIANALKKVLTEKRENTNTDTNEVKKRVDDAGKKADQVKEDIDKLTPTVKPQYENVEGQVSEELPVTPDKKESKGSNLVPTIAKDVIKEAAMTRFLKIAAKDIGKAEAATTTGVVAAEVASAGANTPLIPVEYLAGAGFGVVEALTEYFADSQNRHAKGGPIKTPNKPVLVGEEGPEIFVPESTGNIIPNNLLTSKEKDTTNPAAVEKITSLLTQVISLPSEKLAAISNTTNIGDSSSSMLQTMNKTLLDISDKLDIKNNTNNDQHPSKLTGLMNSSNNSSSNTINIISQGNPITNSRLRIDNFLYNRRANA